MEVKILLVTLIALVGAQNIPTAPTPGQPPATTTTQITGIPTAPPGGAPPTQPTDMPTTTPPPGEPTPAPTPAPPPTEFTCPPSGLHTYPNPEHCQKFITCINGNRLDNICQDGFLFDELRGNCEPAGAVDCGTRFRP